VTDKKSFYRKIIGLCKIILKVGTYLLEGELDLSEQVLGKAFKIFQTHNHPEIYIVLKDLADLYMKKYLAGSVQSNLGQAKRYEIQSKKYREQSIKTLKAHFPENAAHILHTLYDLTPDSALQRPTAE
jgi:hypothetical protein